MVGVEHVDSWGVAEGEWRKMGVAEKSPGNSGELVEVLGNIHPGLHQS